MINIIFLYNIDAVLREAVRRTKQNIKDCKGADVALGLAQKTDTKPHDQGLISPYNINTRSKQKNEEDKDNDQTR